MEVSDILDPAEFQLLNVIVKVLAAKLPNALLFFYKTPTNDFNFVSSIPEGATVNKEFIAKFNELASELTNSMAILPKDDLNARLLKLITKWRDKTKTVQAEIIKDEQNGSITIKFNG